MRILGVVLGLLGLAYSMLLIYANGYSPISQLENRDLVPGLTFIAMGVFFFERARKRRLQLRDIFLVMTVIAVLLGWMRWENTRQEVARQSQGLGLDLHDPQSQSEQIHNDHADDSSFHAFDAFLVLMVIVVLAAWVRWQDSGDESQSPDSDTPDGDSAAD